MELEGTRVMFANRSEAGRRLAERLQEFRPDRPVVLGIARGGVVLAAEVARALGAPLDVLVVRKIGHPANPEYGMGAVTESGEVLLDEERMGLSGISREDLEPTILEERAEIARRIHLYRGGRTAPELAGRTVLVIDDGIATGGTVRAALRDLARRHPRRLVLAIAVAPPESVDALRSEGFDVICLHAPRGFGAVGEFFRDFDPVPDGEVISLLEEGRRRDGAGTSGAPSSRSPAGRAVPSRRPRRAVAEERPPVPQSITIPLPSGGALQAELAIPVHAFALVVFAHGSGSGRLSPRNRHVADALAEAGVASLLLDLLTEAEAEEDALTRRYRFDIPRLTDRILLALDWCATQPETVRFPIGVYGASTGGAVALIAAAARPNLVRALVLRGARSDLAGPATSRVHAPTLLLVGGLDPEIREINEETLRELRGEKALTVIPGASHLFEEPGALDRVAAATADWFHRHLGA